MKSVIIIGAGASGLAAGIAAARGGAEVTVLEAQERPGKKLLVTGNGRCNLTNLESGLAERYYGSGAALARRLLIRYDAEWTLNFFHEIGLLTRERDGYVYPYSNQASSVLFVLLLELRRLGGKLKLGERVRQIIDCREGTRQAIGCGEDGRQAIGCREGTRQAIGCGEDGRQAIGCREGTQQAIGCGEDGRQVIGCRKGTRQIIGCGEEVRQDIHYCERKGRGSQTTASGLHGRRFEVVTDTWTYRADCVILACGSCASPSTGACLDGYRLAGALGHTITRLNPALSPLICPKGFPAQAAGVRCPAKVSLPESGISAAGELQWTKNGVSGIAVFQLSRFVPAFISRDTETEARLQNSAVKRYSSGKAGGSREASAQTLSIDLFPDYETAGLTAALKERAAVLGDESITALLRGFLNEKLISPVLKKGGKLSLKTCAELEESDIQALCLVMKDFRLPVTGARSFEQAQVCAGGVDCSELTEHLESRLHKGLYICGELADVDGPCGGYNLQWAFAGGYEAGWSAAAC